VLGRLSMPHRRSVVEACRRRRRSGPTARAIAADLPSWGRALGPRRGRAVYKSQTRLDDGVSSLLQWWAESGVVRLANFCLGSAAGGGLFRLPGAVRRWWGRGSVEPFGLIGEAASFSLYPRCTGQSSPLPRSRWPASAGEDLEPLLDGGNDSSSNVGNSPGRCASWRSRSHDVENRLPANPARDADPVRSSRSPVVGPDRPPSYCEVRRPSRGRR